MVKFTVSYATSFPFGTNKVDGATDVNDHSPYDTKNLQSLIYMLERGVGEDEKLSTHIIFSMGQSLLPFLRILLLSLLESML